MGIFNRLFKIGQSEAHAIVDKLEDPIKLTEQGIRDLKKNLDDSLKAFAEIKALSIRSKKAGIDARAKASEYEQKAMILLQRAETGAVDMAEAERLATEALNRKGENEKTAELEENNVRNLEAKIVQMDGNIKKLRSQISHFENELKTLRARAMVSQATKTVNKQLANVDSTGTVAMLERMKEKVEKDESLAEAYGDIANESRSVDEEIEKVLGSTSTSGSDALAALKAKMAAGKAQ
jgi:phage shock protein A